MAFIQIFESDEAEALRLAQSPATSINHELSKLPVTMHEHPEKKLIMLPRRGGRTRTIVVLPYEFSPSGENEENRRRPIGERQHLGHWNCIVIQSDDPRYPATGYDISISIAELRRGKIVRTTFDHDETFEKGA